MAYRNVLVAVNGSPSSEAAWRLAVSIVRASGGRLRVVGVEETPPPFVGEGSDAPRGARWRALVNTVIETARAAGVDAAGEVLRGYPAEVIVGHGSDCGCDLIVIGTSTGHPGALGRTADKVVDLAACGVLVVRWWRSRGPAEGVVMFRKILVGLDGSETSWHAFRRALALARQHGSELWVLSVEDHLPHFAGTVDEVQDEEERENAYFQRVQQEARELAEREGIVLHCRTTVGHAAERLLAYAQEGGFDLVVVGHRGHASPWHRLAGSTADRLVDHAPCSVLVERPRGAGAPAQGWPLESQGGVR